LSFLEGGLSISDFRGSEREFVFTFSGLSFIELVVGELFGSDFIIEVIKDSGDGVHWTTGFKSSFNLGHDVHDGSFFVEVEGTLVFF